MIGQAAEFDYAGTQACLALKEEGLEVVLVNSNPATIMTDSTIADHVYIEPLTLDYLKMIIEKEKPDSILSTPGAQTGLTLSMQLAKEGFLTNHGVTLLGANPTTIDKAEDRQLFKETMDAINQPIVPSIVTQTLNDALQFAQQVHYPVIVRPAFTLGGSGGGIANTEDELRKIASSGLRQSPIHQIEEIYVIEVNPRSSRTVPYLSKVTGVPMIDIATRIMLGETLENMGYTSGPYPNANHVTVKVPVFSFEKLAGLDTSLGPEMKSTGEVLGIAPTLNEALYKGLLGSGYHFDSKGGVLITVRDTDKEEVIQIAKDFSTLGFHLYATEGTAHILREHGLSVTMVHKIHESEHNTISLLESGKINYIISTAKALAAILAMNYTPQKTSLIDICTL